MATKTVVTCDVCGAEKKPGSGNWWNIWLEDQVFHTAELDTVGFYQPPTESAEVCGIACANTLYARWMMQATITEVTKGESSNG